MIQSGLKPNEVTFLGVLSACRHAGWVEEACTMFKFMKSEYGMEPHLEHYYCVIDLLGQARHFKEAETLIANMPFEPDKTIWCSMLKACEAHKNIELDPIGESEEFVHVYEVTKFHALRFLYSVLRLVVDQVDYSDIPFRGFFLQHDFSTRVDGREDRQKWSKSTLKFLYVNMRSILEYAKLSLWSQVPSKKDGPGTGPPYYIDLEAENAKVKAMH
ncbi:hypothetical protein EZV62_022093 [Acer yangbiense]|uniref:Pentatricopeptide repeat-containing protein n=1 Tax=Acer yangbiense TaxID=1000413 RepID=A0A5C7H7G9_9ROSI|nr:hypothetical protein EZV62_022093 [Acer yangbiense]